MAETNKRKYIRLDAIMEFDYRIKGSAKKQFKSVTKNISPGGIRGLVDKDIKKGDWLELNVYIPILKEPMPITGKVAWTADKRNNKIDAGIKFEEIAPKVKDRFVKYISGVMSTESNKVRGEYDFV